jgi:glycosyltransferase involved in cell wall biosynthesis
MSSKKMILCSNFMPMPEFANDSVVYFNPKDPLDLEKKLVSVIDNKILQEEFALKALEESKKYSWGKTSKDTWDSLNSVL